ncbi:MAG: cytochrome c3 family protein [Candidatus Eiseniibacteriota bacterium]
MSPGPLAAAHKDMDSALNCLKCHPPGGGSMDARCIDCHTEVAQMRAQNRGLHGHVKDACAKCHPDHGGRDFKLIAFEEGAPEKFDHKRTGWPLEGKHDSLTCDKCHLPKFQKDPVLAKLQRKDHSKSWFGLQTTCNSCHEDHHHGQLSLECQNCHGNASFKPAVKFDHAKSRFPLTGKHEKVECAKCHLATERLTIAMDSEGKQIPLYKPLHFEDCNVCHTKDPHEGKFGKTCAGCHVTDSFHVIKKAAFNHDQTKYPLRGKHATVECAKCHDPKLAWGRKPLFEHCGQCHKDGHAGQATIAGKPADCDACHRVEGFEPSIFTVEKHQLSKYPLEGKHMTADCSRCHRQLENTPANVQKYGPSRVAMRPTHTQCTDCHNDPHEGRFAPGGERAQTKNCLACHTPMAFRPSIYDAAMHAHARFVLDGAHRATPCLNCHEELKQEPANSTLRGVTGARRLKFTDSRQRCAACHESPHGDQFAKRKDKGACEGCHGSDAFAPAAKFDHQRDSQFKLDGVHVRVACSGCHRTEILGSGKTRVIYRPVPHRCEDCHGANLPPVNRGSSLRLPSTPSGSATTVSLIREVPLALSTH